MLTGDVMYDYANRDAQIDVDNIQSATTSGLYLQEFTLNVDANSYVNGYDMTDGETIAMSDLRTYVEDTDTIIAVYVAGTNDLVYLLVL